MKASKIEGETLNHSVGGFIMRTINSHFVAKETLSIFVGGGGGPTVDGGNLAPPPTYKI